MVIEGQDEETLVVGTAKMHLLFCLNGASRQFRERLFVFTIYRLYETIRWYRKVLGCVCLIQYTTDEIDYSMKDSAIKVLFIYEFFELEQLRIICVVVYIVRSN